MSLKIKTPPASLAELLLQSVCDHLRRIAALDESPAIAPDDLAHIRALTEAAVALMDGPKSKTRRALLTQTWTLCLDCWPDKITQPLSPVQSVSSVKYYSVDGLKETFGASNYKLTGLASWDPQISLLPDKSWPQTDGRDGAIEIEFVAGYGDALADVPAPILQAIRLLVAHWYESREAVAFATPHEIPMGVATLIQPYRIYR